MRYQNRIYIQTPHSCIRNKDIVNVTTSSDFCEFQKPTFNMVGADKIKSGTTINDDEVHIISTGNTINLTFDFSGNSSNFINFDTSFSYKIYKYNPNSNTFISPELFDSGPIEWSTFSGMSAFTDSILISELALDGEYLIKGNFTFNVCTNILNALGDTESTFRLVGNQYGLYDENFDYYFAAIRSATKPIFGLTSTDTTQLCRLLVETFIVIKGTTQVTISNNWNGSPIVSVNGITLFEGPLGDGDFTTENYNTITFNSVLEDEDIVTVAYTNSGNPNGLVSESSIAPTPIISGVTNGQGSETIYFNTDTNKYEVFTLSEPVLFNDIIITLNGITLGNGLDYNQSSSDPKRIILEGELVSGDIITLSYNSFATYVGVINVDNFDLLWTISPAPINTNGIFTAYVANDESFSAGTIIYTASTNYVVNESTYSVNIDLSGYSGTTAYYKVTNQKNYTVLSGGTIQVTTDSDIIPIEIEL